MDDIPEPPPDGPDATSGGPDAASGEFDAAWESFAAEPTAPAEPPRRARPSLDALAVVAIGMALLTAIGLITLRPTGTARRQSELATLGVASELYEAEIVEVVETACTGEGAPACEEVTFELLAGPDSGERYTQVFPPSAVNPDFDLGAEAILARRSPNATVTDVATVTCPFDEGQSCRFITLALSDGDATVTFTATNDQPATRLGIGDEAVVEVFPDDPDAEVFSVTPPDVAISYQFSGDFQRRSLLLWVTLVFVVAVVLVGRWRGVAAIAGLIASLGILLLFVLPAILDGNSPILVAVVGASAIAFVTLYLAHGFTRMTTVALVGMISALALTALLSALVVELARFSGFATEESALLTFFDGIDVRGLLLAGIVLGTAGALDDVTVTQASATWQLKNADPGQDRATLFARALSIGRDHIASTVNTLLLAYAGAALPLLVLLVLSSQSLGAIANSEVVAVEIIRTLVGSIGLVAAVPITTWLAARTADGSPVPHSH